MHTVLLVIHIIVTFLLVGIILLQRSDTDGFGLGGGGSGLMTGRAQANFFTRATAVLATIFIITSLSLTITGETRHKKSSLIDQLGEKAPVTSPASKQPTVPKPE